MNDDEPVRPPERVRCGVDLGFWPEVASDLRLWETCSVGGLRCPDPDWQCGGQGFEPPQLHKRCSPFVSAVSAGQRGFRLSWIIRRESPLAMNGCP
jgi:hypothetical protein